MNVHVHMRAHTHTSLVWVGPGSAFLTGSWGLPQSAGEASGDGRVDLELRERVEAVRPAKCQLWISWQVGLTS